MSEDVRIWTDQDTPVDQLVSGTNEPFRGKRTMRDTVRIANESVRRSTRVAFLASALIFLVTIGLGFLNAMTSGALPRWQVLVHLHSGTLGWITLSVIAGAIWLGTGDRDIAESAATRFRWLVWLAILAFLAAIVSFGLAFAQGGDMRLLLGVTGPIAALVIWAAAVIIFVALRGQAITTTAHWLVAAALVAAGLATTMGGLVAMGGAGLIPLPPELTVIGHVIAIEGYLLLAATGFIEWLLTDGDGDSVSAGGLLQIALGVALGVLGPLIVVLALAGAGMQTIGAIANLGVLVGIVLFGLVFFARIGPTVLERASVGRGGDAWATFATGWVAVAVVLWPLRVALGGPPWWITIYAHVVFVGVFTNLILGLMTARTASVEDRWSWAEPAALWVANGGLVVFAALEIGMDVSHGAWIMGVGVLLGVLLSIDRLVRAPNTAR